MSEEKRVLIKNFYGDADDSRWLQLYETEIGHAKAMRRILKCARECMEFGELLGSFYVYKHIMDGEVFYIGKGSGNRGINFSRGSRNKLWEDTVYSGGNTSIEFVEFFDCEEKALDCEARLIREFMPRANLRGITDSKIMITGWRSDYLIAGELKMLELSEKERLGDRFIKAELMDELIRLGMASFKAGWVQSVAEAEEEAKPEKKKPAAKRFLAPKRDEVMKHMMGVGGYSEEVCKAEAEMFHNYWGDMNWARKGTKMTSWKGSATNWIKKNYGNKITKSQSVDRLATPDRSALKASVVGEQVPLYQPLAIEGEFNECE